MKFAEGDRVILGAFEDCPEERGTVIEYEGRGMYLVQVDAEYQDGEDDDGLREVPSDQLRGIP